MTRMALASAAVLAATVSAASAGPVVVITQERSVEAAANVELNGVIDAPVDTDTAAFDAIAFAGSASVTGNAVSGEQRFSGSASATQNSNLAPSRYEFTGAVGLQSELTGVGTPESISLDAHAASFAEIVFQLDETTTLTPTNTIGGVFDGQNFFQSFAVFDGNLEVADFSEVDPQPIDLPAGQYLLSIEVRVLEQEFGGGFTPQDATYAMAVDFSSAGGGSVIPLPPGVWAGLLTLASGGLVSYRKLF